MSPSVTYWTGTWDPRKEAISKEIQELRQGERRRAPVVAFSPAHTSALRPAERVLLLSHRRWLLLRAAARAIEPMGQVTHVFGGRGSWHLLRSLGRRPILLTAVVPAEPTAVLPHLRLAHVVVETDDAVDEWRQTGIDASRIEVVRPGIDLSWHTVASAPPADRPALLFASTPADPAELDVRGFPLLVELARARPDLDVIVPWRQWGDLDAARGAIAGFRPPSNLIVQHEDVPDMRARFARAHATVLPFAPGAGKACPNFVVEGLAAGRPCVASRESGVAALLDAGGAGLAVERSVHAFAAAVDRVMGDWAGFSSRARALAERAFDVRRFRARYEALYREIASRPA